LTGSSDAKLPFMYSYPNLIPVDGATVRNIVSKLEPYNYSKLYGMDAKTALKRSAERYLRAIGALSDRKSQTPR